MGQVSKVLEFPEVCRYKPETAASFLAMYQSFLDGYESPAWLKDLRYGGLTVLEEQGIPTPKLERWKYTNLTSAIKGLNVDVLAVSDVSYDDRENIVQKLGDALVDAPKWLVDILNAAPAGASQYHDMALWDLCNVYLRDGLVIDVPAGKIVDKPVEITITGHDNTFFVPRTVFRLGEGAELTIIERHEGSGRYWNNRLTQIIVGKNAKLRHYRIQDNNPQAVYTQNTHVQIERDATYEAFTLTTGAGLSRNQIHADLIGENGNCDLYGLNLLRGQQHGDTTITIEHQAPHCYSNQFYRTVLNDRARGVFQGKVHVHQAAQKTDGYQLSNTLLLSDAAEMDTKPELEIYADDVKCSHGATTGQLDDEPLFYLRSRGLNEQQAKALLINAFLEEVTEKLSDRSVAETVTEKYEGWLSDALR